MQSSPSQQYSTYPMSTSHCASSLTQHQVRCWEAMNSRKRLVEFLGTGKVEDLERKAAEWGRREVCKCWSTLRLHWESLGVKRLYRSSQRGLVAGEDLEWGSEIVSRRKCAGLCEHSLSKGASIGPSRMKLLRTESPADISRYRRCQPGW